MPLTAGDHAPSVVLCVRLSISEAQALARLGRLNRIELETALHAVLVDYQAENLAPDLLAALTRVRQGIARAAMAGTRL